jgi:hypothetical protein
MATFSFAILNFKKKKKEEALSSLLFFSGMSLVTSASSDLMNSLLITVALITGYDNIERIKEGFNYYYFITGIVLIIISICLYFNQKNKIYILNINGYFVRRIEDHFKTLNMSNFEFKEREIDFINLYNKMFAVNYDEKSFDCIKEIIQQKVEAFKNETRDIKKGYTGIAPIPLIMFAGTFLERTKIDEYYEFDKIKEQKYYKLKNNKSFWKKRYQKLLITRNFNNIEEYDEIVIAISLTKQISKNELKQFKNHGIIQIGVEQPKDNLIEYKEQLFEYSNVIVENIEDIVKQSSKINRIHLVYSGQSCLSLELGKRFIDTTRLPEIISYHYDRQSEVLYPWGVIVNGKNKGQLIKLNERS